MIKYKIIKDIELNWIHLKDNYYAYRIITFIDGEKVDETEGISTIENIRRFNPKKYPTKVDLSIELEDKKMYLINNEAIEKIRTSTNSIYEILKNQKYWDKPYSLMENTHSIDGYDIYFLDFSKGFDKNLYNLKGERLPFGISFDFIHNTIESIDYDLEKAIRILEKRTDIVFKSRKKIKSFKHRSSDIDTVYFLNFEWYPSVGDFNKLETSGRTYDKHYIMENIFKIKRLK